MFLQEQCPYMFDVKNEGAGFLQVFGELVIVPFVYTIQPRYILEHHSAAKPSATIYALFGLFFRKHCVNYTFCRWKFGSSVVLWLDT